MFLLIAAGGHSQQLKQIDYILLSRACDTLYYDIAKDSSRASFGIYFSGYHVKAKRDSLASVIMKRKRDFPNVIQSGPMTPKAASFWATTKKNVPAIDNLSFITLEEFYQDTSRYFLMSRLFFIVPKKNGTFDIWESGLLGRE
ncbi:MAG TPA: hypothetical protein VFR70_03855 [Flavobacterium sp.]|nr:hypothetical protein [Flavobacterium sp.]